MGGKRGNRGGKKADRQLAEAGEHEGQSKVEGKLGSDTDPGNMVPWEDGNAHIRAKSWERTIARLRAEEQGAGWSRGGDGN